MNVRISGRSMARSSKLGLTDALALFLVEATVRYFKKKGK